MIAAVAVLERNPNNLLQYLVKRKAKGEKIDKYLGMLYPIEEYKVYGYLTNTDIKFILVVQDDINIREQEIKQFFIKVHELYVQVALNPFYEINSKIESPAFEKAVAALVNKGILTEKDRVS